MASGIEFTSSPGKVFTAWVLKSPTGYATLASGGTITEVTSGRYQFATTQTGVVWVEATAGATKAIGFADLDNPESSGYAEVTDERPSQRSIANQIDGLSSITPSIVLSFDPLTKAISLVRNDAYLNSLGTAIEIPVNIPTGIPPASITSARLGATHKHDGTAIVGTVTILQVASQWTARIEFAMSATSGKTLGEYDYDVEITYNSQDVTILSGNLRLIRDYSTH